MATDTPRIMRGILPFFLGITLLASCASTDHAVDPAALRASVQGAVDSLERPESDRALDDKRKPVEVLSFFGIQPGMRVLDVFGGGGYYTEILSHLVSDSGSVTLYNNNPWDNFVKKQVAERLADNRLENVSSLIVAPESLSHDGVARYDAAIFILGIVDHNAEAGTDPAVVGKTLRRVDPDILIRDLESVGFRPEEASEVLSNPADNLTGLVFNPELRYQTDRCVLRFRKPG